MLIITLLVHLIPNKLLFPKIGREDEDRPVFHVGYHQDTTDNPDTSNPQAGHYQSLEKVPGRSVECCGISRPPPSPATPTSPPLITITTASPNMMDVVVKIQNEESILNVLAKNKTVVGPSLKRLIDMKQEISVDILFETKVCQIISEKIQPEYDSKTYEGKMCRKLLLFFQSLCRNDPAFDDEELPVITDISSDDDAGVTMDPPPPPVRSFRALFSNSRVSSSVQSTSVIACRK